jgi:hypothetical protein
MGGPLTLAKPYSSEGSNSRLSQHIQPYGKQQQTGRRDVPQTHRLQTEVRLAAAAGGPPQQPTPGADLRE